MKNARFQMRIDEKLLDRMKKIARRKGIALTHFVEAAFRDAVAKDKLERKPIEAEQI